MRIATFYDAEIRASHLGISGGTDMAAKPYRLCNPFTVMDESLKIKGFGPATIDPQRAEDLIRRVQ